MVNNTNSLTQNEMKAEVLKQLEFDLLPRMKEKLLKKVEKAFRSGAIPDEWFTDSSFLLSLAIMESLHKDELLDKNFLDKRTMRNIKNLHLFL